MISNRNVGFNGLIIFWKRPRYPSLILSLQPIITWLLNFFGNKIIISQWDKKLFQSVIASTTFYFKLGQALIQKGQRQLFQSRSKFISKWDNYFKVVKKLFQSEAIILKWGKSYFKVGHLLQNGAKFYFKVRNNTGI